MMYNVGNLLCQFMSIAARDAPPVSSTWLASAAVSTIRAVLLADRAPWNVCFLPSPFSTAPTAGDQKMEVKIRRTSPGKSWKRGKRPYKAKGRRAPAFCFLGKRGKQGKGFVRAGGAALTLRRWVVKWYYIQVVLQLQYSLVNFFKVITVQTPAPCWMGVERED